MVSLLQSIFKVRLCLYPMQLGRNHNNKALNGNCDLIFFKSNVAGSQGGAIYAVDSTVGWIHVARLFQLFL